jgi:colicin import membrane protein
MATAQPPNTGFSATARSVINKRREPGRGPAAVLALVVHAGFFALIIFGVSWQVKPTAPISAELWATLPNVDAPAPLQPAVEPVTEPVAEPVTEPTKQATKAPLAPPKPAEPSKADIALKAKLKREEQRRKEEAQQQEERKRADEKRKQDEERKRKQDEARAKAEADRQRQEAEAREAAVRAARDQAVRDYANRIASLIRNRANIPDSVTGQPEVQVRVRLLTNGSVFEAAVSRPSGNRAFDEAVERAINGIRQWPVPDNPEILGRQRELLLNIKHER